MTATATAWARMVTEGQCFILAHFLTHFLSSLLSLLFAKDVHTMTGKHRRVVNLSEGRCFASRMPLPLLLLMPSHDRLFDEMLLLIACSAVVHRQGSSCLSADACCRRCQLLQQLRQQLPSVPRQQSHQHAWTVGDLCWEDVSGRDHWIVVRDQGRRCQTMVRLHQHDVQNDDGVAAVDDDDEGDDVHVAVGGHACLVDRMIWLIEWALP